MEQHLEAIISHSSLILYTYSIASDGQVKWRSWVYCYKAISALAETLCECNIDRLVML